MTGFFRALVAVALLALVPLTASAGSLTGITVGADRTGSLTNPMFCVGGPTCVSPLGSYPAAGGPFVHVGDGSSLNLTVGGVTKNFPAWWATLGTAATQNVGPGGVASYGDACSISGGTDCSGAKVTATGGTAARTNAARASDVFNARDFGAFGDGASHTVSATLGLSTLAALKGYTTPAGKTPYSWIGSYPFGQLFRLPVSQPTAAGGTVLQFSRTAVTGVTLQTSNGATASGASQIVTSSYDIGPGQAISAANGAIPSGTTTGAGTNGNVIPLSNNTTASIPALGLISIAAPSPGPKVELSAAAAQGATTLTGYMLNGLNQIVAGTTLTSGQFGTATVQSVSCSLTTGVCTFTLQSGLTAPVTAFSFFSVNASYELDMQDTTGLYQGQSITGSSCLQANTTAMYVNASTGKVRLNQPTTCPVPGGTSLTFAWPSDVFSRIVAGMQAGGAGMSAATGIPAGDTVASVNTSAQTVTLASVVTAALTPATPTWATTPQIDGTFVDFYAPYTDAQAAALQMDALGIQAAEQAAEAKGFGKVLAPGGTYLLDETITFPLVSNSTINGGLSVSLVGDGSHDTFLYQQADLGPGMSAISCGDPTGDIQTLTGLWANNGMLCYGEWTGFSLRFPANGLRLGVLPYAGTHSTLMSGMRQGPRRMMHDVDVSVFNVGIEWQADHTTRTDVRTFQNFMGQRVLPTASGVYGDESFYTDTSAANSFADVSIHPLGYLEGNFNKPFYSAAPYSIFLEPGSGSRAFGLHDVTMFEGNFENEGCGMLKDGSLRPDSKAIGGTSGSLNVTFDAAFAAANPQQYGLPFGCPWTGYIDQQNSYGLRLTNVWPNAFSLVQTQDNSQQQPIVRTYSTATARGGYGGIEISGPGVASLASTYTGFCQSLVDFPGYAGWTGYANYAWARVRLEQPGSWHGTIAPFFDTGATSIANGTILEWIANGNFAGARRAGQGTAGAQMVAGTVEGAVPCNMNGRFVTIGTGGSELPVAVSATQAAGTLLKVDTANPGKATAATSLTDGLLVGLVPDNNSTSALVYVRSLMQGGAP